VKNRYLLGCLQGLSGRTAGFQLRIKGAMARPNARKEPYFSMTCEGTDRR
jgi:hypothetical protein